MRVPSDPDLLIRWIENAPATDIVRWIESVPEPEDPLSAHTRDR